MKSSNSCAWAVVILLAAYVAMPGDVSAQQATTVLRVPPHTYPFASYLNPYAACMTNEAPSAVFLLDYPWGGTNETDSCMLRGIACDGKMWLQAEVGGTWNGAWLVTKRDGTVVASNATQSLDFSLLPRGAHKVQLWRDVNANPLPPFWVAWPSNTVPACRFPATGYVHGKIVERRKALSLHVWGQAREPLAAATSDAGGAQNLWWNSWGSLYPITIGAAQEWSIPLEDLTATAGGSGVTQAWVRVDGNLISVALDATGAFDLLLPLRRTHNGVHDIVLVAVARNQSQQFTVDREYVSEVNKPFPLQPDTWNGGNGGSVITSMGGGNFIPSGIAVAFPGLDEKGWLILDGRESVGASLYRWTIRDRFSGTSSRSYQSWVQTECLPAGFYEGTLDCSANEYSRYVLIDTNGNRILYPLDPYADQAVTRFDLVIPPRVNLTERQVQGALHIRWVYEKVNNKATWCLYLSGHVFDGIGTSMYGFTANNLYAWVTINETPTPVTLDNAGHFLARWVAGKRLATVYDLTLSARTLDDGKDYLLDTLHETKMSIFLR